MRSKKATTWSRQMQKKEWPGSQWQDSGQYLGKASTHLSLAVLVGGQRPMRVLPLRLYGLQVPLASAYCYGTACKAKKIGQSQRRHTDFARTRSKEELFRTRAAQRPGASPPLDTAGESVHEWGLDVYSVVKGEECWWCVSRITKSMPASTPICCSSIVLMVATGTLAVNYSILQHNTAHYPPSDIPRVLRKACINCIQFQQPPLARRPNLDAALDQGPVCLRIITVEGYVSRGGRRPNGAAVRPTVLAS